MHGSIVEKEWFCDWFDSPFYHLLYQHRDETEAREFIKNLMQVLALPLRSKVLDVACGKGRHAILLHQLGLDVVGVDLSAENIAFAQQFATDQLQFYQHDMRHDYPQEAYFDVVLNLFTSFGYFDSDEQHVQTIRAIAKAMKRQGIFVLDFFNTPQVLKNLPQTAEKQVKNVRFFTQKYFSEGFVCKDIQVECLGHTYHYQERVRALDKDIFLEFFQKAALSPQCLYGNYQLAPYDPISSERMIWVVKKN